MLTPPARLARRGDGATKVDMTSVLFVCTGNICRSPTAEALFRHLAGEAGLGSRIVADSCGLGGWHVGNPPDRRAIEALRRRGIDMSGLRARQFAPDDFTRFDLLLAMDRGHLREMIRAAPDESAANRVRLFLEPVSGDLPRDVPDPYYGGVEGFERALDLIETGARAWLDRLAKAPPPGP